MHNRTSIAFFATLIVLLGACDRTELTEEQDQEQVVADYRSTPEVIRYEGRALVNGQIPVRGTGVFPRSAIQVAEVGSVLLKWPSFGGSESYEETEIFYRKAPKSATDPVELFMNEGRAYFYVKKGKILRVTASEVQAEIGSMAGDSAFYLDFSLIDPYFVLSFGEVRLSAQKKEPKWIQSAAPVAVTLDREAAHWHPSKADLYPTERLSLLQHYSLGGK